MDTPASVAVRTAFGTRDIAQRVVEFLPFDEVAGERSLHVGRFASRIARYYGAPSVKATCRGLRNAARRALTRGRWRPVCRLAHEGVALSSQLFGTSHDHTLLMRHIAGSAEQRSATTANVSLLLLSSWPPPGDAWALPQARAA